MDEKANEIEVVRVSNGWLVMPGRQFQRGYAMSSEASCVARTPDELANLIHEWASKQRDGAEAKS